MKLAPTASDPVGAPAARRRKFAALDFLKWNSTRPRQRACQSRPRGATVSIDQGGGSASFVGLQSCGSIACPHCGPKIAATRTRDVQHAVGAWRQSDARSILFGTLTLRHHQGQSLDFLLDAASRCWKAATNGRAWRRDRLDYGIGGYVRVFEVTRGHHGWHVHVHFLAFVDDGASRWADASLAPQLLASMFDRWSRKAVELGLRAPLLRAQDLHPVTGDAEDAARSMGLYFAKQAAAMGEQDDRSIAFEVTGGPLKAQGSMSPGDLLQAAIAGDPAALRAWGEYELAIAARRTIGWSRGLRELVGLDAELTDQEAAELVDDPPHEHPVRVHVAGPSWSRLVRLGLRGPLLEFARTAHPVAVAQWLADRDLVAWIGPADDPPPVDEPSPAHRPASSGGFVGFLADRLASGRG